MYQKKAKKHGKAVKRKQKRNRKKQYNSQGRN